MYKIWYYIYFWCWLLDNVHWQSYDVCHILCFYNICGWYALEQFSIWWKPNWLVYDDLIPHGCGVNPNNWSYMRQFRKEAINSYNSKHFAACIFCDPSSNRRLQSMLPKSNSIFPVRNKLVSVRSHTMGQPFLYRGSQKPWHCIWADDMPVKSGSCRIFAIGWMDLRYHKWWAWLLLRYIFLYFNELSLPFFKVLLFIWDFKNRGGVLESRLIEKSFKNYLK